MQRRNAKKRTRVEQLRPLLTQIYEMDSDSDVTVIEHSDPRP
jgi:hypothetical protein